MNFLKKTFRYACLHIWYVFAIAAVFVAIAFVVVRILLPSVDQYNLEVSSQLSRYLKQTVVVKALDAEWHGMAPSLVLKDVSLLDAKEERRVLQFDKVRVGVDLLNSLRQWQPVFLDATLMGLNLTLTRTAQGHISVAGIVGGAGSNEDLTPFIGWLFSQSRLRLEDSDITWVDESVSGRKMHFSAVNLSLRNDGDRHLLDVSVNLPSNLGKSLDLKIDLSGNPAKIKECQAKIYISGEEVHLAELLNAQPVAGVEVSIGNADFRVWADWDGGQIQHAQGDVEIEDLLLASLEAEAISVPDENDEGGKGDESDKDILTNDLALEKLAGQFLWQREKEGWKFDVDQLMLSRKGRQWEPARVVFGYSDAVPDDVNSVPSVKAFTSFLQLDDVSRLLSLFSVGGDEVQQALSAIFPKGEIKDAQLNWWGGVSPKYDVYAKLQKATVNAWQSVPAAENVDGQLWLNATAGQVLLEHAAMTLDLPKMFRGPLQIDELHGAVAWQSNDDGWSLSGRDLAVVNADISSQATFDIIQNAANESPFVSLIVDFQDGDGSQVSQYLPISLLPEAAVNWLDEAIVNAQIVSGGALFHGYAADFPFDNGDGKLEVAFTAENAHLNYMQDWPPVSNINAEVRFFGRGMTVKASQGKIYSNEIQWANINIPDMTAEPMLLMIDGEMSGATQDKLDYLVNSPPLYESFAQNLKGMSSNGNSLLHLNLDLPIGAGKQTTVSGWVDFMENTLSIPPIGRVLSKANGRLEFFQDGLKADKIQSELLGQAAKITIATDQVKSGRKIHMNAKGLFNAPDLAARYFPAIKDMLSGDAEWDVSFDIPMGADEGAQQNASLYAKTNMQGIEAGLPAPFIKKADDVNNLELWVDFQPKGPPLLSVNYADTVEGIFELGGEGIAGIQRGEVRLNGGQADLPEQPGLRLVGWLDTISLGDWQSLLAKTKGSAKPQNQIPLIKPVDIAAREMEFYGQTFHDAQFKLLSAEDGLQVDVNSDELKGKIQIPQNLQLYPIKAVLTHCYLNTSDAGEGSFDPREIPNLSVRIADFRYDKRQFGNLILETTKVVDGMRIEQFILKPRSTVITSRGGWYIAGDEQNSNIQMHVNSTDIGRTLKALDYVGGISDGEGTLDLKIQWPGSFADVDASQIQGKLNMRLKNGYLLDVDPGAGRVFGMLSIQTLPRRLFLDFSDVFNKGFGFDIIEGDFSIDDGDAYTNNTYMDGPAARVEITGRTGLVQQDYDQEVMVTPHVLESLPMLGVLAATPQVAATILFFQKLFQPEIDVVAQNPYTITGSWNAPIIKKIKKPKAEPKPVVEIGSDEL